MNKKQAEETSRNMIDILRRKYSYLLIKEAEFIQAKDTLEKRVTESESDSDINLLNLGIESLSKFRDSHIKLVDRNGKISNTFCRTLKKNYDLSIISAHLSNPKQYGPIRLGRIGKVIYIGIDSFDNKKKAYFDSLYQTGIPTEKEFIIDLRGNGGGNEQLGKTLVSFLLGNHKPILSSYIRYRIRDNDPTRLSDYLPKFIYPSNDSPGRKVIVLVGGETCSSAEQITLDLAAIPDAIMIGDITAGSSGCPKRYFIEGPRAKKEIRYDQFSEPFLSLYIPSWLAYNREKVLIQDNGIIPNILIQPQESIRDNKDLVLEKAIEVLN